MGLVERRAVRRRGEALDGDLGDGRSLTVTADGGYALTSSASMADLRLPRVDGHEVLRAIRADPRTKLMPVVVLTSSHEESDVVRAYDLGANSYLVKPVASEAFMAAVRELGLYWMLLNKLPGDIK